MKTESEIEVEIVEVFRSQARVLQRSPDPRKTIIAARWQIFFDSKIAEIEREIQQELKLPAANAA